MRNINLEITEKIKRLQKDGDNFNEILELCKPLLKTAIKKVEYTNPITYDELYNESIVRLWEVCMKYEKKPESKTSFSNYVVTDIIYYLINYIRNTQTNIKIPANEYRKRVAEEKKGNEYSQINNILNMKRPTEEDNPFDNIKSNDKYDFENDIEDERLIKGFSLLTEEENDIIKMYIIDGYNFTEISKIKNMNKNKVRKIYKSGIEKFKL